MFVDNGALSIMISYCDSDDYNFDNDYVMII